MTITEKNAPVVILSEYENGLALAKKVYARYELYGYVDKDKNVVIPFSFEWHIHLKKVWQLLEKMVNMDTLILVVI